MKYVFWDMDGTLITSEASYFEAINLCNTELGFPPIEKQHVPLGLPELWGKMMGTATTDPQYARWLNHIDQTMLVFMQEGKITPRPHIVETLEVLQQQSVQHLCVTNSSTIWANRLLGDLKLRDFFTHVITRDDVPKGKPHPDPYLHALKRVGATPDEALVIEDSPVGIQAGQAAGIKVVAFIGEFSKEECQAADVIVTDIREIMPLLG